MNVAGDYTHTLGSFSIVDGSGSTGYVNVSGNYTHTAGTLTVGRKLKYKCGNFLLPIRFANIHYNSSCCNR
ncbi:MAG: hypothetical protein IPL24_13595 [Bacteroidetes bacterium]|nr:hypothetical protein [Bacteroidota bacterium]